MKPIIVPGTESATEPISVAEAGEHLRAANDGGVPPIYVEEALITRCIKSARQACEAQLEMSLVNKQLEVSSDTFFARGSCESYIELPNGPVISVVAVNYLDPEGVDQLLDPDKYRISRFFNPPLLYPTYGTSWPMVRRDIDSVRIKYNVGYPSGNSPPETIPEPIRTAMFLLIGHFYDNREAISDKSMTEVPLGVCAMLDKYRQALGL